MNFLPVGHTEEDVDQFFSKVSIYLLCVGAETINGNLINIMCVHAALAQYQFVSKSINTHSMTTPCTQPLTS